jgi:hypothetical protein
MRCLVPVVLLGLVPSSGYLFVTSSCDSHRGLTRWCSGCHAHLQSSSFSNNQWKGKQGAHLRRCRTCVDIAMVCLSSSSVWGSKTVHVSQVVTRDTNRARMTARRKTRACAQCGQSLSRSAFSRHQLSNHRADHQPKCLNCTGSRPERPAVLPSVSHLLLGVRVSSLLISLLSVCCC